jgi:hypothetical protein
MGLETDAEPKTETVVPPPDKEIVPVDVTEADP